MPATSAMPQDIFMLTAVFRIMKCRFPPCPFPHPGPLPLRGTEVPEGEGDAVVLREFHVNPEDMP
jgi:hypothetical protein